MKNILFVNSVQKQCGVYDYGVRSYAILKKSVKYNFIYAEASDITDYMLLLQYEQPAGVIFNYHPSTMPWLNDRRYVSEKRYCLWHEGSEHWNLNPDYWLYVDSTREEGRNSFSIPRPLPIHDPTHFPPYAVYQPIVKGFFKQPLIGTFGFAFGCKGLGRIVKMVNEQYDEAVIRIHIPRAHYGDKDGEATAGVMPGCRSEMVKSGIDLEFTTEFLPEKELLTFLETNDLNIFLYDEMPGRGLSSVIDYAVSVNVPLAINSSGMFRHIQKPEINVANKTLQEIIDQGVEPLKEFKELWSNKNFLDKYEYILDSTL